MTNLMYWQPSRGMRRLRSLLNRMMDESLMRESYIDDWEGGIAPVDLFETNGDVVLKAALPGVEADDIDISISDGTVNVQAEMREEHESENEDHIRYHVREQNYRRFARTLRLPEAVDSDAAEAEFENGVLRLRMPKLESQQTKSVTVKNK